MFQYMIYCRRFNILKIIQENMSSLISVCRKANAILLTIDTLLCLIRKQLMALAR